jgi:hypothetical protein
VNSLSAAQRAPTWPEDKEWHLVWKALWKATPGDSRLVALTRSWLTLAPPDHAQWGRRWRCLWNAIPVDGGLAATAREWLLRALRHPSWLDVWNDLLLSAPHDRHLIEAGVAWLTTAHPGETNWPTTWATMWKHAHADPRLCALGEGFLRQIKRRSPNHALMARALVPMLITTGQIFEGRVGDVLEYGAFVDLGVVDGLLHRNECVPKNVAVADVFETGQTVRVRVLEVKVDEKAVRVSLKPESPLP